MEWISVEDSPPPKSEKECIAWGPGIGCLIATFVGRGYAGYLKRWDHHSKTSTYSWYPDGIPGITHWMPLPEPPKCKRRFAYESSGIHDDSGYVIYDSDNKRIEPWDLVNALNNPLPDGLAFLCDLGIKGKDDD